MVEIPRKPWLSSVTSKSPSLVPSMPKKSGALKEHLCFAETVSLSPCSNHRNRVYQWIGKSLFFTAFIKAPYSHGENPWFSWSRFSLQSIKSCPMLRHAPPVRALLVDLWHTLPGEPGALLSEVHMVYGGRKKWPTLFDYVCDAEVIWIAMVYGWFVDL